MIAPTTAHDNTLIEACRRPFRIPGRVVRLKCHAPPGEWPVAPPRNWLSVVNRKDQEEELSAVRHAVVGGAPFGDDRWRRMTAAKLGLLSTLRPRGRPRKSKGNDTEGTA